MTAVLNKTVLNIMLATDDFYRKSSFVPIPYGLRNKPVPKKESVQQRNYFISLSLSLRGDISLGG